MFKGDETVNLVEVKQPLFKDHTVDVHATTSPGLLLNSTESEILAHVGKNLDVPSKPSLLILGKPSLRQCVNI